MLEVAITKFSYKEKHILQEIHFALAKGEHLAILGESGSGKSSLIHLIYGLLELEEGQVLYKGELLLGPSQKLIPGHSFMKLLAQEYDIMPYITVAENIGSYLTKQDMQADEMRIAELLKVVDLEAYKNEYVKNLSGGQKQRVALAKALANTPTLLLLDEPFSHIDLNRKTKLRRSLFNYLKAKGIGCIYATHDSKEALSFSDTILMLGRDGTQEMLDTPENIYKGVQTAYQASFFGEVNDLTIWYPTDSKKWYYPQELFASSKESEIQGLVRTSYYQGGTYLIEIETDTSLLYVNSTKALTSGTRVFVHKNQ